MDADRTKMDADRTKMDGDGRMDAKMDGKAIRELGYEIEEGDER